MIADRRAEQAERRSWSDLAGPLMRDAPTFFDHLDRNSHHVDAVRSFEWEPLLPATGKATVLDLGCGTGWLTAMLSARGDVTRLIAWDSSPKLLGDFVSQSVEMLDGDMSKVELNCAEFTPLLLDDGEVDLAVMASAFHHAAEPDELLRELHRVLRPGGAVVLLNEVPYPVSSMLRWIATTSVAAGVNAVFSGRGLRKPGHVAADHALYDPVLGDRAMTMRQWQRLFAAHPFEVEVVESGLAPYRAHYPESRGRGALLRLTHFVLRPSRR